MVTTPPEQAGTMPEMDFVTCRRAGLLVHRILFDDQASRDQPDEMIAASVNGALSVTSTVGKRHGNIASIFAGLCRCRDDGKS